MIQLAGGENVYQDAGIARPTISLEAVLAADPEVIVLNETSASPDEIRARQGWEKISAVRNGRIHVIPFAERAVTLYSPRCAECCERTFLRWFHPEVLTDEERH
jgi:iron complex transport system substrate-binding protein